jgi:hypothetical protein
VARATAAKVAAAMAEKRPSPLGFTRTTPPKLVADYLDYVENVQGLAWRTVDRYRAALARYEDFCADAGIDAVDRLDQERAEGFVRWLRGRTRTRNGAAMPAPLLNWPGGMRRRCERYCAPTCAIGRPSMTCSSRP